MGPAEPTTDDAAPRLLVRTVASRESGFGHAMRCLAIAEAWRERGGSVVACYVDGLDAHRSRYDAAGIRELRDALPTVKAQVFDGVSADEVPLSIPTLCFDDNGDGALPADAVVLNPNAHANRGWYAPSRHPAVLLGPRFAPLRSAYRTARPGPPPSACARMLVTFGGADPGDRARRVLHALGRAIPGVDAIDVVVGPACPFGDFRPFEGSSRSGPPVVVHRSPSDLVDLVRAARLVVSSCGNTVWELCALGRAFAFGAAVPYEEPLAAWLARTLGPEAHFPWDDVSPEALGARVASLCADDAWLDAAGTRAAALCDGLGAIRVVDLLWSEAVGHASLDADSMATRNRP